MTEKEQYSKWLNRALNAEKELADVRELLRWFELPHFQGAPLTHEGYSETVVMVSRDWYEAFKAAAKAVLSPAPAQKGEA